MSDVQVPARVAATGIAGGLFLMTVFTLAWVANTFSAWPASAAWVTMGAALIAGACFVTRAAQLLGSQRRFPTELSDADKMRRRSSGRAFGLVFAAEGLAIWLALTLLGATGHTDYNLPVVVLIVGLHFYPMARIFERRIDTYLATWTCVVGLVGVVALVTTDLPVRQVWAAAAVGAALATATYGAYMVRLAGHLLGDASAAPRRGWRR